MDAKKTMLVVAVALVLLYTAIYPSQAAGAVQGLLDWLKDGAVAILGFFRNVFG